MFSEIYFCILIEMSPYKPLPLYYVYRYELKKSESNVTLGIGCHCRNKRGSGQGYTCHYFGDPTGCQAYSEDPKNFYVEIIEHIEGI